MCILFRLGPGPIIEPSCQWMVRRFFYVHRVTIAEHNHGDEAECDERAG